MPNGCRKPSFTSLCILLGEARLLRSGLQWWIWLIARFLIDSARWIDEIESARKCPIDPTKKMISRNVAFEVKCVEQLRRFVLTPHPRLPRKQGHSERSQGDGHPYVQFCRSRYRGILYWKRSITVSVFDLHLAYTPKYIMPVKQ